MRFPHLERIKIDKNIPIPKTGTKSIYPFAEMEVGDSFSVDISQQAGVKSSSYAFGNRQTPIRKFTTRKINENEARIWRIK